MNWKPIETAPKDGATVDLMNAASGLRDRGHWCDYIKRGWSVTGIAGEWNQERGNGDMTHWRELQRDCTPDSGAGNGDDFARHTKD